MRIRCELDANLIFDSVIRRNTVPFLSFVTKKFEKLAVEDTWSDSFLRQKWEKWTFFQFFTNKSYCFVMNLNSTQFQLSFEIYYLFVAKNWKFEFFAWKYWRDWPSPLFRYWLGAFRTVIDAALSPVQTGSNWLSSVLNFTLHY